jgi:hypothetical protein
MNPTDLPLRDIHLPPDPGWWPLAPGWWLLAALLLLTGAAVGAWCYAQRRNRRPDRIALKVLRALRKQAGSAASHAQISALSILLRRVSISLYPRTEAASLTGEDWLRFLDRAVATPAFSQGIGRLLIDAPYRPNSDAPDLTPLYALCERWIAAAARSARRPA